MTLIDFDLAEKDCRMQNGLDREGMPVELDFRTLDQFSLAQAVDLFPMPDDGGDEVGNGDTVELLAADTGVEVFGLVFPADVLDQKIDF